MSGHIQKMIEEAQSKLRELESEVSKTKQQINWLCGLAGLPLMNFCG
jgi:vacuolar-type H+-ATPase subunit D/Vma8